MPFDGNPHPYEPPAGAPFDQVLRDLEVARGKVALGWVQHRQQSGDRYCAYGAVLTAALRCTPHSRRVTRAAARAPASQPDATAPGAHHNVVE